MRGALLLAGAFLCVLSAGCAPGRWRMEKEKVLRAQVLAAYAADHPDLPEEQRRAILEDRIIPGMDRTTVTDLRGEPKQRYRDRTGMMEVWFYETGYVGFDKEGRVVTSGEYRTPPAGTITPDAAQPETTPAVTTPKTRE